MEKLLLAFTLCLAVVQGMDEQGLEIYFRDLKFFEKLSLNIKMV